MIEWKKYKVSLLIIFAAALVYLIFLSCSYNRPALLKEEIRAVQGRIEQLTVFSKNLSEAEGQIETLQNQIRQVEEKIPGYDCSNEFARELYGFVLGKKLNIDEIRIDSPIQKGSVKAYRFTIETSGSLDQIKQVIGYMNNHKRKLVIRTFSMREKPDSTYSAIMSVELYHTTD